MLYGSCKPLVQIGLTRLVRPDWYNLIGPTILDWPLWSDLFGLTK